MKEDNSEKTPSESAEEKEGKAFLALSAIPLGLCLGVCYSVVFDNLALGIGLGLCFGAAFSAIAAKRNQKDEKQPDTGQTRQEKIQVQTADTDRNEG